MKFEKGHKLKKSNIPEDVWKYINKKGEDECWEWRGRLTRGGYGSMSINNKTCSTHRLAYIETYGFIPPGLCICHRCNNPRCCNPKHLWAGTQKENVNQVVEEKRSSAKLTEESVLKIRELYPTGNYTYKELGQMFGGRGISTIVDVVMGRTWKHLLKEE